METAPFEARDVVGGKVKVSIYLGEEGGGERARGFERVLGCCSSRFLIPLDYGLISYIALLGI